jgi:hypothetical protein
MGVERVVGFDLLGQRAAHGHLFLLETLGQWDVQVLQVYTGEVVPFDCHDDLLYRTGVRGRTMHGKTFANYRARVPGIKGFVRQSAQKFTRGSQAAAGRGGGAAWCG